MSNYNPGGPAQPGQPHGNPIAGYQNNAQPQPGYPQQGFQTQSQQVSPAVSRPKWPNIIAAAGAGIVALGLTQPIVEIPLADETIGWFEEGSGFTDGHLVLITLIPTIAVIIFNFLRKIDALRITNAVLCFLTGLLSIIVAASATSQLDEISSAFAKTGASQGLLNFGGVVLLAAGVCLLVVKSKSTLPPAAAPQPPQAPPVGPPPVQ